MKVECIPAPMIYQVWDRVVPFIDEALRNAKGEYNSKQLRGMLENYRNHFLVVATEDSAIHGCATVEFIQYPNYCEAFVTTIGGKGMVTPSMVKQFEQWARTMGATAIRGNVRESVARLWRRFGYDRSFQIWRQL